jgi:hypothetical protein
MKQIVKYKGKVEDVESATSGADIPQLTRSEQTKHA